MTHFCRSATAALAAGLLWSCGEPPAAAGSVADLAGAARSCRHFSERLAVEEEDAAYDRNCDAMDAPPAALAPATAGQAAYFDAPVPRTIHQIWYGPPQGRVAARMRAWRDYAAALGYAYRCWGADDDAILPTLMDAKNQQIFHFYRDNKLYKGASNVLRLHLLQAFGGIYLDSDTTPPHDEAGAIDLAAWLPMRNIAAMVEGGSRETHSSAVFWTNCLLMSAPHHPIVRHMIAQLPANHAAWHRHFATLSEYTSGPFFLSKSWSGAMTAVRMDEAYRYHLLRREGLEVELEPGAAASPADREAAATSGWEASAPPPPPAGPPESFTAQERSCWRARAQPWTSLPNADVFDDPMVHRMRVARADGAPRWGAPSARPFDQPIPRIIHQLAAAPDPRSGGLPAGAAWAAYADSLGYAYRLHTPEALRARIAALPAAQRAMAAADGQAALALAALDILGESGGIFVGPTPQPPHLNGQPLDLSALAPLRGLVVVSQRQSRNLGDTSLWVASDLLMATPEHPAIRHLQAQAAANWAALVERGCTSGEHMYGSVFLSRALGGSFTVVPASFADHFGLHVADGLRDAGEPRP